MADLFDLASNQIVQVPDDKITEAFNTGRYTLPRGRDVGVRQEDGEFRVVPPEQANAEVDKGNQIVPAKVAKLANLEKDASNGTGAIAAFHAKAASAFSMGISDQIAALIDINKMDRETEGVSGYLHAAERMHPLAATAGTIGGTIAQAAVMPGGGFGSIADLGGATALGKLGAKAAAGALEGGQFGLYETLSEGAFDNEKLTTEHFLSNIGMTALWGGGISLGLAGAGQGVSAIRRSLAGDGKSLATVAARQLGVEAAPGLEEKMRKAFSSAAETKLGARPGAVDELLEGVMTPGSKGYRMREMISHADDIRDQAVRDVRTHIDEMLSASKGVSEEAKGELKRAYVAKAVTGVDAGEAYAASTGMMGKTLDKLNSMIGDEGIFGHSPAMKRAHEVVRAYTDDLAKAAESGDVAGMFVTLDKTKRAIGSYTKAASQIARGVGATDELALLQGRARAGKLQELYEELKTGLEDSSVWKKAGEDQKAINGVWTRQLDAESRFHRALTVEVGRDPANPWIQARGVDPAKADSYVKNLIDPKNDLVHSAVKDYVDSTKELTEAIGKAYDLPAAKVAEVQRAAKAADSFRETISKAEESLTAVNQFHKIQELERNASAGALAQVAPLVGSMMLGPAGAVLGSAYSKVAQAIAAPSKLMQQVAGIERHARESKGAIGRVLNNIAQKRAVGRTVEGTETYARKAAQVERLAASPDMVAERISNSLGELSARMPSFATTLTTTALGGLSFLHDKLPPQPAGDPFDPRRKPLQPDPYSQEKWLRYYTAVTKPITVVADIRDGRPSLEGVEVLKTVYPEIYSQVRGEFAERMAAGKLADLSYQQRLSIGTLLDLDVDGKGSAHFDACQQAWARSYQAQKEQDSAPRKPLNLTKNVSSPTAAQRVEAGR